ncbi:MAG: flagellin [Robiginitomaculum sp.]|nr:MAG: flagellin [Robiginitomaculum sp.]
MSSILTNSSAMVALETLRGINKGMNQVQNEISTGKKVANAKDNAAIYAISTVMTSDVASFDKISDSLNLGSATVGVARAASEKTVELLTEMKGLIVAAQEENVDRSKIQTDVAALKTSIDNIVGAAQFNGQNLIKGEGSINVLASLDRDSSGSVTATNINVGRASLETNGEITAAAAVTAAAAAAMSSGDAGFAVASGSTVNNGATATVTFDAGDINVGDEFKVTVDGTDYSYTSVEGDTITEVAAALTSSLDGISGASASFVTQADPSTNDTVLTFSNTSLGDGTTITTESTAAAVEAADAVEAKAAGGLAALDTLDVSTAQGATDALAAIDALLATAIDAASSFGSAQKSIEVQDEFVNSLMDSMKVGIGAMVDADMEEASARLQSLQVQQQLGVQALSIANQAPQSLLTLFR